MAAAKTTTPPLVATYFLLADESMPQDVNIIPNEWNYMRFDTTDVLYVCSFFVLPVHDAATNKIVYKFGLQGGQPGQWFGIYEKRYNWIVREARVQNPHIRIIAMMMMWDSSDLGDLGLLTTPESREEFTDAVRDLLVEQMDKTYPIPSGQAVSARIDGFDVDYEILGDGDHSVRPWTPEVFAQLRRKLDGIASDRKFYLSVSPATYDCLNDNSVAKSLDYVNMQRYDGGAGITPKDYVDNIPGLQYSQLMWGMSSETPTLNASDCTSVADAVKRCAELKMAGVWTWRINSGNWVYENMVQIDMFSQARRLAVPAGLDDLVQKGWDNRGLGDDGKPVSPWTEADWVAAKEWRVQD